MAVYTTNLNRALVCAPYVCWDAYQSKIIKIQCNVSKWFDWLQLNSYNINHIEHSHVQIMHFHLDKLSNITKPFLINQWNWPKRIEYWPCAPLTITKWWTCRKWWEIKQKFVYCLIGIDDIRCLLMDLNSFRVLQWLCRNYATLLMMLLLKPTLMMSIYTLYTYWVNTMKFHYRPVIYSTVIMTPKISQILSENLCFKLKPSHPQDNSHRLKLNNWSNQKSTFTYCA